MFKICIIIPCYNEYKRLLTKEFYNFVQKFEKINFIFVNDGSIDSTIEILNKFKSDAPTRFDVLNLSKNVGKAEAVRLGIRKALEKDYSHVGYWDADLATPLSEIPRFIKKLENNNIEFLLGTRFVRLGVDIKRKLYRHLIGRVFATFASIIIEMPVYDTQCGAKIIKSSLAEQITRNLFTTRWLFDVELIIRAKKSTSYKEGSELFFELPLLKWDDVHGSKLKLFDFLKAPLELLKIWAIYRN